MVALALKQGVSRIDLLQGEDMRDERGSIDLAGGNQPQQRIAVTAIHTAGFEGQVFAVHIGQRKHLRGIIQRHNRDCCIRPGTFPRKAEAVRRAGDLEHYIRSAVTTVAAHKFQRMRRGNGQHIGIVRLQEAQPRGILLAYDDAAGVVQQGAQQGADSGRPGADDEYGILGLDIGNASIRQPSAQPPLGSVQLLT